MCVCSTNMSSSVSSLAPAAATPSKSTDSVFTPSKHSPASLRIPKPKKTGNDTTVEQAQANYELAVVVVDEIVRDLLCVQCLWNRLQERKRKALSLGAAFDGSATFKKTYATLRKLVAEEPEWVALYLASASDLSPEEVVRTTKCDSESLHKMLHADTQLSGALRLSKEMHLKNVMWQIFTHCSVACGRKLKDLKASGRLLKTWAIDYPSMCYIFTFEEGVLCEVTHRSSGVTVNVAQLKITADYNLQNPWSDLAAQFVKPPMAPTKVSAFFKKDHGPLSHKDFMKPAEFKKVLTASLEHVQEQAEARNAASGVGSENSVLVADLHKKKEEEKSERMKRLRCKAREEMARKTARTVYKLTA